ncbi:glycosyltransferase [Marinicauda algicola]|uniref:Glycosyltransferase n=1 Tax=Marinicauda algicola TaxID=2029849 RepID=A0A4S2H3U8_9PROT|nr:methyltransferase domain-containing protein [Marinicauda algicola]TGY90310.1 glycosyltransferase [Marinicauda algicola]
MADGKMKSEDAAQTRSRSSKRSRGEAKADSSFASDTQKAGKKSRSQSSRASKSKKKGNSTRAAKRAETSGSVDTSKSRSGAASAAPAKAGSAAKAGKRSKAEENAGDARKSRATAKKGAGTASGRTRSPAKAGTASKPPRAPSGAKGAAVEAADRAGAKPNGPLALSLDQPGNLEGIEATGERFIPGSNMSTEVMLEHMHRYVAAAELCRERHVLDIASGSGYGSFLLGQTAASVLGVDVDHAAIRDAQRVFASDTVSFRRGSAEAIPAGDNSFDCVVSFETIEHIEAHDQFLTEIRRVLKPGGLLIMSSPDKVIYNAAQPEPNPYHLKELTEHEFRSLLARYFENVSIARQRVTVASVLASDEDEAGTLRFGGQRSDQGRIEVSRILPESPYLIALCSDLELPKLPTGLFEGVRRINPIASLEGGVAERDARIVSQMREIEELRQAEERIRSEIDTEKARLEGERQQLKKDYQDRDAEMRRRKDMADADFARKRKEIENELRLLGREREVWEKEKAQRDSRYETQIEALDREVRRLTQSLGIAEGELAELTRERLDLAVKLADSQARLESRSERAEELSARAAKLEEALVRARSEFEDRTRQLRETEGERDALKAQIGEAVDRVQQLETAMQDREQALNALAQERETLRQEAVEAAERIERLEASGREREEALNALAQERETLRQETVEAAERIERLEASGREREEALNALAQERETLRQEIVEAAERLEASGRERDEAQRRNDDLASALVDAQRERDEREAQLSALQDDVAKVRQRHESDLRALDAANAEAARLGERARRAAELEQEIIQLWASDARRRTLRRAGRYLARKGQAGRAAALLSGLYQPGLLVRPLRAISVLNQAKVLERSSLFDADFYRSTYPDVASRGEDPVLHYLLRGADEGRNPGPDFSTRRYLSQNPDVASSGLNPLYHFIKFGVNENRSTGLLSRPPGPVADQGAEPPAEEVYSYEIRPDDIVKSEVQAGENFLSAHALLGDAPRFGAAVEELARLRPSYVTTPETVPAVSIVIPVYGQLAYTLNCLSSLAGHHSGHGAEIIVVDDSSIDETPTYLPQIPWIRYVRQPKNGGFIASCNRGAAEARGQTLVFLNNDTRVVPGWLDELIGSFSLFPDAGLVGSKLFYPDGSLQEAGGIVWRDGSAWNYGRNDDPGRPEYCYARQVDYCSGASIAVPRTVWDEVGGFDGEYYERSYCEDSDLAFQIRATGRETWFQPLSRVVHYEGKTSGTDLGGGEKAYQVRNQKKFFDRWSVVLERHAPNGVEPFLESDRPRKGLALVFDANTPRPDHDAGSITALSYLDSYLAMGLRPVFAAQDNFLYLGRYTRDMQRRGIMVVYSPYYKTVESVIALARTKDALVQAFRHQVGEAVIRPLRDARPDIPFIFHNSDLHFQRMQREASLTGDSELFSRAEQVKARELQMFRAADCNIVHTPEEAKTLNDLEAGLNVQVLPHVYPVHGTQTEFSRRFDIAFLGGYRHPPNVDAVRWFAQSIWPQLKARLGGARFLAIGAEPPPELLSLQADDFVVTGRVDDLRPYLDSVRVFVAPLRYGAGLKAKVATALSYGVPSVVTSVAAEGMELAAEREVLIADEAGAFCDAVERLYNDEALWKYMSVAGQNFVQRNYSEWKARKKVLQIVSSARRNRNARQVQEK